MTVKKRLEKAEKSVKILREALLDFFKIEDKDSDFDIMEMSIKSVSSTKEEKELAINGLNGLRRTR